MENLSIEEMEATRGGFLNHSLNGNKVTVGNTAVAVNASVITGSANRSGGIGEIDQDADANAGNIS
jgi:hypothetical protein